MAAKNSTRDDVLRTVVDIDNHINFIRQILDRYNSEWTRKQKNKFEEELTFIANKRSDPHLYLSVIGEFSSGKSTLINALLRDDFLEANVLQGTTVASAIIKYDESYFVSVHTKSENAHSHRKTIGKSSVLECLAKNIKDDAVAKSVDYFEIGHPATLLKDGLAIIDTPGTNSLERWHEDVTKEAIQKKSDVSIILTSADKPLPESLLHFVENNLNDILPRCVFLVTKMDLLLPHQREEQLDFIKEKVKNYFNIENPMILPYTSIIILRNFKNGENVSGTHGENDQKELVRESIDTEKKLITYLNEQKIQIQLLVCIEMLGQIIIELKQRLENVSAKQAAEHEKRIQATTHDLSGFINDQKRILNSTYHDLCNAEITKIMNMVSIKISADKKSLFSEFNNKSSETDVRNFIGGLDDEFSARANTIINSISLYSINLVARSTQGMFEKNFSKNYSELSLLATNYIKKNLSSDFSISQKLHSKNIVDSSLRGILETNRTKENIKFYGGAAAGAVIGTLILPVIGTAIGAWLGARLGIPNDGVRLKQEIRDKFISIIDDAYSSLEKEIRESLNQHVSQSWKKIDSLMNTYLREYTSAVTEIQNHEKQEQKLVLNKITLIKKDLAEINERKNRLEYEKKQLSYPSRRGQNRKKQNSMVPEFRNTNDMLAPAEQADENDSENYLWLQERMIPY